ncbi:hypothetical protein [Luteolibacter soli]|uniref:EF-hand domain-containing protein n=1 Tax=Luteolibacter soli TaxID=3135280 RepID=A0ABU9ANP6_9BACT
MKSTPIILGLVFAAFSTGAQAGERKISAAKIQVFTKLFNEANTDGNNYLDFEEFSNSYGASPRPVITEFRFDEMSRFIKSGISTRGIIILPPTERGIFLDDFIEASGGRAIKPNKTQIFFEADDNESGGLDIEEFAATRVYPPSNPASTVKAFEKIDKNDDGIISPSEWGIDIKV